MKGFSKVEGTKTLYIGEEGKLNELVKVEEYLLFCIDNGISLNVCHQSLTDLAYNLVILGDLLIREDMITKEKLIASIRDLL